MNAIFVQLISLYYVGNKIHKPLFADVKSHYCLDRISRKFFNNARIGTVLLSSILAVATPVNSFLIFHQDFGQSVCMNSFLYLYAHPTKSCCQFESVQN